MLIHRLTVDNLRILRHVDLQPRPGVNLIVGGNGAGKTSVLEAIYLAGRGRTFRHQVAGPMIRDGEQETLVLVRFGDGRKGMIDEAHPAEGVRVLGIKRGRSGMQCRLDGREVRKRSTLAANLPTQWISSQPQLLLEGSPGTRRRFFDMGLFHVEHGYLDAYGELARVLRQRNALLKARDPRGLGAWNHPFTDASIRLHRYREPYIAAVFARVAEKLARWQLDLQLDWQYKPGWDPDHSLVDQLEHKREQDLRYGFTHIGPQRAEISLSVNGSTVDRKLSRGQLKMVVFALHFAQVDLMRESKGFGRFS